MTPVRLSIPDDVIFEVLEDEAVLLKLESGIYFSLNKTGTIAWRLIQERGDLEDVTAALCGRYELPAETVIADLDRLVRTLVEKGLLVAEQVA